VDFIASTVKTVRVPSPFEKVNFVDCRSTFTAGDGGAFLRSMYRVHPRFRYTPTVSPAQSNAAAALHRAYFAASLFFIRIPSPAFLPRHFAEPGSLGFCLLC
jgi:hypothetical protein